MRVHVVMRCGHVQEWPPGRGCIPGWGCLGSCGFALWRAWLVSEAATSKPPKNQYQCSSVTSQQRNRLFSDLKATAGAGPIAMLYLGLPAALATGAAGTGVAAR